MKCDKIEKHYSNLISYCQLIEAQVDDFAVSSEAGNLREYIKNLSPRMTAAGFFQINRRILSAFLSTLASYIIIIIQFRIVN